MIWYILIGVVIGLVVGVSVGLLFKHLLDKKNVNNAKNSAESLLENAKKDADAYKKELLSEAKKDIADSKREFESDIKERRQIILDLENKANLRETMLNTRSSSLDKKEDSLNSRQSELDKRRNDVEADKKESEKLKEEQKKKLDEISALSADQAKAIIMDEAKQALQYDLISQSKDLEEEAQISSEKKARNILAMAIQKYASSVSSEISVSNVHIPDDMKGRLIGRDGRNLRCFEACTGVELKVDDTPETVTVCGFDPIRREIAKKALELLIADGRIHSTKIEQVVEKVEKEVENFIRQQGEDAVNQAQIGKVNPELIKIIGRLHYRTSYGQNNLKHSLEVAFIAGKLAAELGENEILARRAGLLHDIGKALDHDVIGTHVEIGVNLCQNRFKEPFEVIDSIASHHGDKEPQCIIAFIVAAADAVSASRPGARNEDLQNYVERIQKLEAIPNNMPGVEKAFAIQAGREIRILVKPDIIDDKLIYKLAKDVKHQIENSLTYPGQIKVTVIRETRANETAK